MLMTKMELSYRRKNLYHGQNLLAVKLGKPSELYDMVHTENFVLVDTKKRVRGFYDGTNKGYETINRKTLTFE
jgi:cytochrome oxidase Cu insertion factor (SCO1/SenC/PrrC family)